jgi:NTE family protein
MSSDSKIKVGLALGSGAARGWAHLGVLRALDDLGIVPDVVCGTSIGALVGGFHVSGFLPDLEEWARKLTKLRMVRYLDLRVTSNGMIAGNKLFGEMERRLGDMRFEDLARPFAVVATDLYTGHEVWYAEGEMVPAIRASFSLPGLFEPVRVDDRWVIDGALVNPVPVSSSPSISTRRPTATARPSRTRSARAGSTGCRAGPTRCCAKARRARPSAATRTPPPSPSPSRRAWSACWPRP